ncbi:hypothetical protein HY489_01605 [Candidatus Woesearchaeota archaeon]|nr:hypothetical protein [Candidatus Woesearchaeota archaeon]
MNSQLFDVLCLKLGKVLDAFQSQAFLSAAIKAIAEAKEIIKMINKDPFPPAPQELEVLIDLERSLSAYGTKLAGFGTGSVAQVEFRKKVMRPFWIALNDIGANNSSYSSWLRGLEGYATLQQSVR